MGAGAICERIGLALLTKEYLRTIGCMVFLMPFFIAPVVVWLVLSDDDLKHMPFAINLNEVSEQIRLDLYLSS